MQAFGDFFEKLSDLSRLKGHRVPIGSSLTDRRSGTFKDRQLSYFSKKIPAHAHISRKMRPYFRRGPIFDGGGGRIYNKKK